MGVGMQKRRMRAIFSLLLLATVLTLGYNNCGRAGAPGQAAATGATSVKSACDTELMRVFEASYRPVLTDATLCQSCHTEGGVSPYKFASASLDTGYSTFMQVTEDRVYRNAVNPAHAPGITGSQNAAKFTEARNNWSPGFANYQTCVAGATGGSRSDKLTMAPKNSPELYFDGNTTVTLSWNLSSEETLPITGRFPGIFSVDVKIDYQEINGKTIATGYVFSKPRLQMLTGEAEVEVEGVLIFINGEQARGIEPLLSARKVFRGIDPQNFITDTLVSYRPVISSADQISAAFGYMELRARTDNPPTPPKPTVAARSGFARTLTVPVNIGGDTTARRWCLTALPTKPTSTGVACPGFATTATSNGWVTARPQNVDLNTLGRIPNAGETITFYLWVANSDLKINADAGTGTVVFDSTPPNKTTISVSVTDTQIADLSVSDTNETAKWCVKESGVKTDVENDQGCNYVDAKPTYVGLRGSGTRYVAVFARDLAGNASSSNVVQTSNPFGRISFTQLTTASNGARAVIANRCNSCHGTGQAQVAKMDSSSYDSVVANKAKILDRTNNSASPMPTTGLIPVKERALIQLWFSQTTTPVQQ